MQCSSVVQTSLIPQQKLYRKFSATLLYRQVSSHSSHYTASSVQICCTAKSHPTAVTILPVQCGSFVQSSLIPQQSLYCHFRAALLYSRVSSLSSNCTASSVQLCCTTKYHPTAVTILPVRCSSVYSQVLSGSNHYTASSVQLCCTAKSHPTVVTILPVQCSSVVQPSLIPQQSLYRKLSAALLYRKFSSDSSHYTASSV